MHPKSWKLPRNNNGLLSQQDTTLLKKTPQIGLEALSQKSLLQLNVSPMLSNLSKYTKNGQTRLQSAMKNWQYFSPITIVEFELNLFITSVHNIRIWSVTLTRTTWSHLQSLLEVLRWVLRVMTMEVSARSSSCKNYADNS